VQLDCPRIGLKDAQAFVVHPGHLWGLTTSVTTVQGIGEKKGSVTVKIDGGG
jgi:hypothetical protein